MTWWPWVVWAAWFVVFETLGIVSKRKGDTLSENLRGLFHTATKAGRWVWIITLGVLFMWLGVHIAVAGAAFLLPPVPIRLKDKYLHASHGRNRAAGDHQGVHRRRKTGEAPTLPGVRTMVLLPTGKTRMEWR
jgi:hypothetical protein